jgi:TonB family protein
MAWPPSVASPSLRRATLFSMVLHVFGPPLLAVLALLTLLLLSWLLHFNFWDWFRPKGPPPDLEFALVRDTHATRPEKPVLKGAFNQRAGGKHNPKTPLKPPESESPPASSSVSPAKEPPKTDSTPPPRPVADSANKPVSPTPIPDVPAKASENPPSETTAKTPSPEGKTGVASPSTPGLPGSGPSLASISNPQGGESGTPGVDVAQDADFGPFMADLERRIKRNWLPPRGSERRRVKLVFYLLRDGRLFKVDTVGSSGDPLADRAAVAAVEASAPFMAFPPQVKEDVLPVEFTFDYNVLNPKNTKPVFR